MNNEFAALRGMDDMILLSNRESRNGVIDDPRLRDLPVFTHYEMKVTSLSTGEERQSFFVPKAEADFYEHWKAKVRSELLESGENAALLENIMRRHRI